MNTAEKLEGQPITTGKAIKPFDQIRNTLNAQKGEFVKVLPGHISFEKFQRTVMTAILQNNDLIKADRGTLLMACIKAATDGLLPDGRDSALVIFKKKQGNDFISCVQYMPMYAGILKKIRQSGELASVETHVVYQADQFEYTLGDDAKIVHVPYMGENERGQIIAAYCITKLKDGSVVREVLTRGDIEKVRLSSKAGAMNEYDVKKNGGKIGDPKGIWKDWYAEMARKTAFRRCAKWLPQNIELVDHVFKNDDSMAVMGEIEGGQPMQIEAQAAESVDDETGEVTETQATTPEPTKQPDLKEEIKKKAAKPADCKTCVGSGVLHTADGKEPCKDCSGSGKAKG